MFGGIFQEGDERDASLYPGVSAEVRGILDYYGAVNLLWEDVFPSTTEHHLPESPEGCLMGRNQSPGASRALRKSYSVSDHGGAEFWMETALDAADGFMKKISAR